MVCEHADCIGRLLSRHQAGVEDPDIGRSSAMARRYGRAAGKTVERAMRRRKRGTLTSGRSGKKVTSRKQAIAIGLSEARKKGAKVPRKRASRRRR